MPAAITSYTTSYELYEGLRSAYDSPDAGVLKAHDPSSFDMIMIFWEHSAEHLVVALLNVPLLNLVFTPVQPLSPNAPPTHSSAVSQTAAVQS